MRVRAISFSLTLQASFMIGETALACRKQHLSVVLWHMRVYCAFSLANVLDCSRLSPYTCVPRCLLIPVQSQCLLPLP